MPMLDFKTITGVREAHCVATAESAETFWRSLPQQDPAELSRRICEALAAVDRSRPEPGTLRGLRVVDRRLHRPLAVLLSEHAALARTSPQLAQQHWRTAFDLCHGLGHTYDRLFRFARSAKTAESWDEHIADLAVRVLWYREIELYLTLCRYSQWAPERWRDLHAVQKAALSKGVARRQVVMFPRPDNTPQVITPEQAYARSLILALVCNGEFDPAELAYVRRVIARHVPLVPLRVGTATGAGGGAPGFVVDLSGSTPATREAPAASGVVFRLDTTEFVRAIDREHADLMRGAGTRQPSATTGARKAAILSKVRRACSPEPVHVARRGPRTSVTLVSVKPACGDLATLFAKLGESPSTAAEQSPDAASENAERDGVGFWQVCDQSESGCRLRGRATGTRTVMPGALLAIRAPDDGVWTLTVVRRVRKRAGSNVEVGVEYIGRAPQCVALATESGSAAEHPALYLPPCTERPAIAIKTLVMPAGAYAPGRELAIVSRSKHTRIRLKEALDHQVDFVWTSFELCGDAQSAA